MVDATTLIESVSVTGALAIIGLIVFAESGLLIGLLLPGDTLLFAAGFFAAQGQLPLMWVMVIIFFGAILGDNTGYLVGRTAGPRLFRKKRGLLFRKEHVRQAQRFYRLHGAKTVMFARFVPYIRTLAPILAGIGNMRRSTFVLYNIVGALLWTITFVMLGYVLGIEVAERIEHYAVPALLVGILFAFSPTLVYLLKNRRVPRTAKR